MSTDNTHKYIMAAMALLSAVLLSIPFLVPGTGLLALVGFVPLLFMDRLADRHQVKSLFLWHYACFVLWNAFTTFWVCNATVGGGLFAIFANALQMSVVFGIFRAAKKHFRGVLPYIFLAVLWIAWERAYFSADISWPWLVLGNAFARNVSLIQWYEFTGTLGGSLWIWACNLGIFGLACAVAERRFDGWNRKAAVAALSSLGILVAAPVVLSLCMYANYRETDAPLDVAILQPNLDPYHKFQAFSQDQQNVILLSLAEEALENRAADARGPLLLIAPETFTDDVVTGNVSGGRTFRRFQTFLQDYPDVGLLFGASAYDYINSETPPSPNARKVDEGLWVISRNSAILTDRTGHYDIFHKSRLVVGVESTPYPEFFTKVDDLLGGVMGRCEGQEEISLLNLRTYGTDGSLTRTVPLGCAICYESVYGEYCTGYVRKGAKALTIITNDAWWGNTPGYIQHLSYASLRAIETRRDIARCGNTGISAIINQRGDIIEKSEWWEPAVLKGKVNLNDAQTFFVREGDIAGRVCTLLAVLLVVALVVRRIVPGNK